MMSYKIIVVQYCGHKQQNRIFDRNRTATTVRILEHFVRSGYRNKQVGEGRRYLIEKGVVKTMGFSFLFYLDCIIFLSINTYFQRRKKMNK